jgi:ADP-ribose pyrophosphatase YjhB (NUDIX family)
LLPFILFSLKPFATSTRGDRRKYIGKNRIVYIELLLYKGRLIMRKWLGSAGLCINENGELLMVLQGTPEEKKTWTIPSGGKECNESFQECCLREMEEETGYITEIIEDIKVKKDIIKELDESIEVEVHYFLVKVIGGKKNLQDPDQLIYDIAWKKVEDLKTLELSFPEDRDFLIEYITNDRIKSLIK